MNGTFVFVLSILVICFLYSLVNNWIKHRNKTPDRDDELEQTLEKVEQLEDRIRVLERIITENRFDLKREIDSL